MYNYLRRQNITLTPESCCFDVLALKLQWIYLFYFCLLIFSDIVDICCLVSTNLHMLHLSGIGFDACRKYACTRKIIRIHTCIVIYILTHCTAHSGGGTEHSPLVAKWRDCFSNVNVSVLELTEMWIVTESGTNWLIIKNGSISAVFLASTAAAAQENQRLLHAL